MFSLKNMYDDLQQRVSFFATSTALDFICYGKKGIEKENLIVDNLGNLSDGDHPEAFGKALTNKYLTKDYAQAMLEIVTSPHEDLVELFDELYQLHIYIYKNLPDNLWIASTPPKISKNVKLAEFGRSNKAKLKEIYRLGLKHRYGDLVQLFSGVHFNYSFHPKVLATFVKQGFAKSSDDSYFAMARNFLRYEFIILYLFGSSPFCAQSLGQDFGQTDLSFATCTRALTYKNKKDFFVSFNSASDYFNDLLLATNTLDKTYQAIRTGGEKYLQLNANQIQIENEFYCSIRPKSIFTQNQRPLLAIKENGVDYIECRSLDLDPFSAIGIDLSTGYFLETFFLFCLLLPSALMSKDEMLEVLHNSQTIALKGRKDCCFVSRQGVEQSFLDLASEVFKCLELVAKLLDTSHQSKNYSNAVAKQELLLANPQKTPSARLHLACQDTSFQEYILQKTIKQKEYFIKSSALETKQAEFANEARASFIKHKKIEQAPQSNFDVFLKDYFST